VYEEEVTNGKDSADVEIEDTGVYYTGKSTGSKSGSYGSKGGKSGYGEPGLVEVSYQTKFFVCNQSTLMYKSYVYIWINSNNLTFFLPIRTPFIHSYS
jgi:hypothetical protein